MTIAVPSQTNQTGRGAGFPSGVTVVSHATSSPASRLTTCLVSSNVMSQLNRRCSIFGISCLCRWRGAGSGQPTDGVEVAQGLGVRLEQGGLAVGHLVRRAESGDQRLRPAQAWARHRREQVVLNL